jgi:DNA repair exonuclease SbcCD ATPase subunit
MITVEEYRKLEVSRDRFLAKQKQLQHDIDTYEQASAEAESLITRIASVRRDSADETQRFRTEFANLKHQIEKSTGERRIFSFDGLKDSILGVSRRDKLASLDQKIESSSTKTKANLQIERDLDSQISILETYCSRCDRIAKKIPSVVRIILSVIDLESDRFHLETHRLSHSAKFSELISEHSDLQTAHTSLNNDAREAIERANTLASELESWELLLASKFADLRATSILIQNANEEIERECAGISEAQTAVVRERVAFSDWVEEQNAIQNAIDEEYERARTAPDVGSIEIAKKRGLIGQLEHKLEEMRAMLLRQREEEPGVVEMNSFLKEEVHQRVKVEQEYAKGKEKMEGLRKTLELKERVIEDLGKWCPLDSKVKVRPGIEELLFVFEVALTRNRDMAGNLQQLRQEIAELEAERDALLAE